MTLLHKKKLWMALAVGLTSVAGVVSAATVVVGLTADRYLNRVERLPDPFVSIPPSARPAPSTGGMTFLLIGLDAESKDATGRGDTLMIGRVAQDRRRAYVISIPRDAWVDIPGHGQRKINSSYALGGPTLAVRTVEQLTRLRIDHVAVIGWEGFRRMTDAVGGVEITIPQDSFDPSQGVQFTAGTHKMDGRQALLYVRQRYGLPRGDLDRTQRQQNFLRALMTQVVDRKTFTDPAKLTALLGAAAASISVDNRLTNDDLLSLAADAPDLRDGMRFLNAPVERLDRIRDAAGAEQSVVYLNMLANKTLFQAVANDSVEDYLAKYGADELGSAPR